MTVPVGEDLAAVHNEYRHHRPQPDVAVTAGQTIELIGAETASGRYVHHGGQSVELRSGDKVITGQAFEFSAHGGDIGGSVYLHGVLS